jgi:Ca-activated chloride channel family protein
MSFTYPALLFLLVLPALLAMWVWRREGNRIALPFDHGRQRAGRRWHFLIGLAETVPPLLLAAVLVILAGPQQLSEPRTKRALTNIEFCVDISGSMTAQFGSGTRYDGSMAAINKFLDFRTGDAFGLTFFGNSVLHWVPLTTDPSAIRCAPPFMKPELAPPWFGGTEIAKALLACKKVLTTRQEGDRMIILISDGMSSDLFHGNDMAVAKELKDANIVLYGIHIAETEVPDPIVNMARLTGGEVFNPEDPDALATVFARIDRMQEARLEKTAAETMDHFFPYCVAALSMLGMGTLTLLGVRYTPW